LTATSAGKTPRVRPGLGREIHDTVAGFVRRQIVICTILVVFYAVALGLTGLHHAS
jgi:predicted PurR-regulated permease PerM